MNRTLTIARSAFLVLVISLAAAAASAQVTTMDVAYQWTAPTTGAAVDHYVVEHSVDGGAWTLLGSVSANQYTLAAEVGVSHRIRVAGVDALGRQGLYSLPSDAYTPDPGAPGQPGKPIIF